MDKDFKHRAQDTPKGTPVPSGLLWFFAGLVIGGFFVGLLCLRSITMYSSEDVSQAIPSVATQDPAKESHTADPSHQQLGTDNGLIIEDFGNPEIPEPHFDFYTILPKDAEAVANQQVTEDAEVDKKPHIRSFQEGEPQYMLQLGSFKRMVDAERRRAELALRTITAEIQTVTINDGDVYHRVRSGPYSSEDAGLLGEKLQGIGISSLTIRLRPEK